MGVDPPIGGPPVLLSPTTYILHEAAVSYYQTAYRNRPARWRTGRTPGLAPGAWGKLAAGATITAASGLALGSGTVALCDRTGATAASPETVSVANAGAAISGGSGGRVLPLEWTAGEWTVCGCASGTCQVCVTATNCAGAAVSGATITVKDEGGSVVGTATTGTDGKACLTISGSGTYLVDASKSGNAGSNITTYLTCPGTVNIGLKVMPSTSWQASASGCLTGSGGALPDATVTINGGTYPTDSTGKTQAIALPPGYYPFTISRSRFAPYSGALSVPTNCNGGGLFGQTLSPDADHVCVPGCNLPVAKTLYASTPLGNATLRLVEGTTSVEWYGCGTYALPVWNCKSGSGAGTVAGSMPWAINWNATTHTLSVTGWGQGVTTSPGVITYFYVGGSWLSCPGSVSLDCAIGSSIVGGTTTSYSMTCPPSFSLSATLAGLTGLSAIMNGSYLITE